jgi:hypothetical protein
LRLKDLDLSALLDELLDLLCADLQILLRQLFVAIVVAEPTSSSERS